MGQDQCCSPQFDDMTSHTPRGSAMAQFSQVPSDLSQMRILEFERRVKKFASPENKGYINTSQLKAAFADTMLFKRLDDPGSLEHKFYLSQFVANFLIGSTLGPPKNWQPEPRRQPTQRQSARSENNGRAKLSRRTTTIRNSVVDDFLEELQAQQTFKEDPQSGLDRDFQWISVNALCLIGCLKCQGLDSEKADVFYRVVQPELHHRVLILDKDIRMAIFFLTNLATILEYLQQQLLREGNSLEPIDIDFYKKKMDTYEAVFDAVIENFNDSMFGEYANSVSGDQFKRQLMSDGWKYFDLQNLNELFSIKYKEMVDEGQMSLQQITASLLDADASFMPDHIAPIGISRESITDLPPRNSV